MAGITARGEPVEILEVDELAPPGADEILLEVAAAGIGNAPQASHDASGGRAATVVAGARTLSAQVP